MEYAEFEQACRIIEEEFMKIWEESTSKEDILNLQKRAMMGYETEKAYFRDKIENLLSSKGLAGVSHPAWYESAAEGIFHSLWGMDGMAEWFSSKYAESSSAKIIGEKIYFLEDGKMRLMPQTISSRRREQLIRTFLLSNPKERAGENHYEIYMADGTRITIFKNDLVKGGRDVIIFRRYVIQNYTLEKQAELGMIGNDFIERMREIVEEGANIALVGELRSGKTTFLSTIQALEDQSLEGVVVETDPELPLEKIMPEAPVIQLIADGEKMEAIVKDLMRSDADYFVFGEARDAIALNTALRIAERGGKRLKMTFHISDPLDFQRSIGYEVALRYGGDPKLHSLRAARAFKYILNFKTIEGRKRLEGLYTVKMEEGGESYSVERSYGYENYDKNS